MATQYNSVLATNPSSYLRTTPPEQLFPQQTPVKSNIGGIVNNAIPGFGGLNSQATGILSNLMGGLPSAGPTKRANAYFGANSGMPGSDFVRNRGFDLYGEKADAYKQRGFDDFLKLISGYSGTVMPTAGQDIEVSKYNNDAEFDREKAIADEADRQRQYGLGLDKAGIGKPKAARGFGMGMGFGDFATDRPRGSKYFV